MPVISERELARLRNKQGIYTPLRNPANTLRKAVGSVIETAFREYVRSHKGKHITKTLEDESWNRFNEILQKYL